MRKSNITSLYDNLHFIFIAIILFILTLYHLYFIPILFVFLIFIIKRTNLIKCVFILFVLIAFSNLKYLIKFDENVFFGTVIECDNKKAIIKSNGNKILIYHNDELTIGDYGEFRVEDIDYDTELFNYSEYLLNRNIKKYTKLTEFKYHKNRFVIGKIQNFFIEKTNENPSPHNNYIKTLIFAYKTEDEIFNSTQKLGISHLLAVSGMHITLLLSFLKLALKRIFYYEKPIDIILTFFLLLYLIATNFQITVLRAVLMVLVGIFFKYKKLLFSKLDVLSIVGIIILLFYPRYLFLLSFQLSFVVSFIIIIYGKNIKTKSKIVQTYLTTVISFLVTFPFIINSNYEINLLSVLIGPIYIIFFEFILYPATLVLFLFGQLYFIIDYVYEFFEFTISYFSNFKEFVFIFGDIHWSLFLIYEILLYFLFVSFEIKRGRTFLTLYFVLFLLFLYNLEFFNPFYTIKMYDVGQGDSFLIKLPHNGGSILIDCHNNITEHLKKDGVKEIDIVILTHGHSDHTSAYRNLVEELGVYKTYSSYYDETKVLKELKKEYNIILLKSGDRVCLNNTVINILSPDKNYKSENNNSLVFQMELECFKLLFTGDIESDVEKELIDKYGFTLESDLLKASHHGSKTSNSLEFLNVVNPKYILISVKQNNIYGFPNNEFLLARDNVYRTDINDSVTFYKRKKSLFIRK